MRERHVYRVEEEEGGNSWIKSGQLGSYRPILILREVRGAI